MLVVVVVVVELPSRALEICEVVPLSSRKERARQRGEMMEVARK